MDFIDRIGYDGGATPLEDTLAFAAQHGFHYVDFSAETSANRVDNWPDDRLRVVRTVMDRNEIAVTVHTASSVNVAEFAPYVDSLDVGRIGEVRLADNTGEVEVHLLPGQGNIDFPSTFRRLEDAGYRGYYTMAFGSLDDKLAARELFRGYGI